MAGNVDHLEVYNFKSFGDKHYIGPFLDFSAIIGPNGGGKSNIMDALSFVLGVRSVELRASNLKELIFKKEGEKIQENTRHSYVELHFKIQGDIIVFKRTISPNGSSEYFINQQKTLSEEYNRRLGELNIVVKAKNFLVFQGQIENIAHKSGRELTEMFELISGSIELKQKYEELKCEQEKAEQDVQACSQRLGHLKAERQKLRTQKQNAEQYEKTMQKVNEYKTKVHLLQLYGKEREEIKLIKQKEEKSEHFQNYKGEYSNISQKAKEQETLIKNEEKKINELSKLIQCQIDNIQEKQPDLARMDEAAKVLEQRKENKLTETQKLQQQLNLNEKKRLELDQEIKIYEKELDKIIQQESNTEMELRVGQQKKYKQLKREAGQKAFTIRKEIERLRRDEQSKRCELQHYQVVVREAQNSQRNGELQLKQLQNQKESEQIKYKNIQQSYKELVDKYKRAQSDLQIATQKYYNLEIKLQEQERACRNAETSKFIRKEQKEFIKLIDEMRQSLPGFKGQLQDLVRPIQARFDRAVQVALQQFNNFLVVDTAQSAGLCNQMLKEKGLQRDILVLENVPERQSNEALRQQIGNQGYLVNDLVECQKNIGLENALFHFVGKKIVCENLDAARNLQKRRIRGIKDIITFEGTVLRPGMLISGGFFKNKRQSTNTNANIEEMKKEYSYTLKEMQEMEKQLNKDMELLSMRQQINDQETQMKFIETKLKEIQEQYDQTQASVAAAMKNLNEHIPLLDRIEESLKQIEKQIILFEEQQNKVDDQVFQDFCQEIGVQNIKEFEGSSLAENKRIQAKTARVQTELDRVKWEKETLNIEGLKQQILKLQQSYQEDIQSIEAIRNNIVNVKREVEELIRDNEKKKQLKETKITEQQKIQEEVKTIKKDCSKVNKKQAQLEKEIQQIEQELEEMQNDKKNTLDELKLKNIEIPLVDQPMHEDDIISIDYQMLSEKQKNMNIAQLKEESKKVSELVEKEIKQVEKLAAEGKVKFDQQKFEEIEKRVQQAKEEHEGASTNLSEITRSFREIQEQRKSKFLETFEPVTKSIDKIYKEMTKSQKNFYYGGNALLYAEDTTEPFNAGIIYSPTPPGKRCMYEMESLSGGEKTIAALSLLFAIQSAHPSPFYILDEVDAHLDWENCSLLLNYLIQLTQSAQVIVITHKETFYMNADSLVGATFAPSKQTSIALSYDLRQKGPRQVPEV